jgi:DNA adenine methylase
MCYLDPPYSEVGKTMYPFGEADLAELANRVRISPHSCLVTVDDSIQNRVLFWDMNPIVRRYASTMGKHHAASELVCANYTTPLYAIHARDIGEKLADAPQISPANDNQRVQACASPKPRKAKVLFSSKTDQWFSPPDLMAALYQSLGIDQFDLDPCSPPEDRATTKAARRYSLELGQNGLQAPWNANIVYLNPPYGRQINRWLTKAKAEVANGNCKTVIGLIPVRTDTVWWQNHVANNAPLHWMVRGRLRFGEAQWAAPFASAIVCWGDTTPFKRALANGLSEAVPGYLCHSMMKEAA